MTSARAGSLRVFWFCSIALTAALLWVTLHVLRLEQREAVAQSAAARQEATRLALWRMDSALTPVIAREASRPYFHYQSFYPTDRAFTRMFGEVKAGEVLVPSPLLTAPVGMIRLYFQVGQDGEMTSPQVPRGEQRRVASPGTSVSASVVAAEDQLSALSSLWPRGEGLEKQPLRTLAPSTAAAAQNSPSKRDSTVYSEMEQALKNEFDQRQQRLQIASKPQSSPESIGPQGEKTADAIQVESRRAGSTENDLVSSGDISTGGSAAMIGEVNVDSRHAKKSAESKDRAPDETPSLDHSHGVDGLSGSPADPAAIASAPEVRSASVGRAASGDISPVAMSDLTPSWIGGGDAPQLVFTRNVTIGSDTFSQGFWLDWQLTRSWLLSGIGDLLPWADLQPVLDDVRTRPPEALGRTLASIPAELVIREPLVPAAIGWTPLRWGIALAWLAILASLVATWRVLHALQELAERRGRFAAAVTHELRTPLTTFCLYTQMLAEDMVPEARKSEYLGTMRAESQRLAGIVESVLEYARLGRHDARRSVQQLELHALLSPLVEKLSTTAAAQGMTLNAEIGPAAGLIVRADPTGVERILTNLVDNACKYAREATPREIELSVETSRRTASITIRDHGPGLTEEESRRVFEPYYRGTRTTDLGVPGLGLGLALAKGVARGMGGDLRHETTGDAPGAAFVLTLEIVEAS